MRRKARIPRNVWLDERFLSLPPDVRHVLLYLWTCPHQKGAKTEPFFLPPLYLAADVQITEREATRTLVLLAEFRLIAVDGNEVQILWWGAAPRSANYPTWPPRLRLAVHRRDDYTCQRCAFRPFVPEGYDGTSAAPGLVMGHVRHRSQGGSDGLSNLQTLCRSCNSKQGDRTVDYRDRAQHVP